MGKKTAPTGRRAPGRIAAFLSMIMGEASKKQKEDFKKLPIALVPSPHPANQRRGKRKHRGNHISTPGVRRA